MSSLTLSTDRYHRPSAPKALCLIRGIASPGLRDWLRDNVSSNKFLVERQESVEECEFVIDSESHQTTINTQVGKDERLALIVDTDGLTSEEIQSLLSHARRWNPAMPRILVFKKEVDFHVHGRCLELGADAVVITALKLQEALQVLLNTYIDENHPTEWNDDVDLIQRRKSRYKQLLHVAGGRKTLRLEQFESYTHRLQCQIQSLPFPLLQPNKVQTKNDHNGDFVRIVHISDTHNRHHRVCIPNGDLFLHTGDICGNYGHSHTSLVNQFENFLQWLESCVCPKFEQVIFLGGNHDCYLDDKKCTAGIHRQANDSLQAFLRRNPNALYLCATSVLYRGIKIYGTPTCICRVETKKKRYVSNAFERNNRDRYNQWRSIPNNVDILLTHLPPAGILTTVEDACPMLANEVFSNVQPRLHAFGHAHKHFGVHYDSDCNILFSNGSQEHLLNVDEYGGGTPIVLDLNLSRVE